MSTFDGFGYLLLRKQVFSLPRLGFVDVSNNHFFKFSVSFFLAHYNVLLFFYRLTTAWYTALIAVLCEYVWINYKQRLAMYYLKCLTKVTGLKLNHSINSPTVQTEWRGGVIFLSFTLQGNNLFRPICVWLHIQLMTYLYKEHVNLVAHIQFNTERNLIGSKYVGQCRYGYE